MRRSKTWIETERQGVGRRYWFRTASDALAFAAAKHADGWPTVMDSECSTTVWVASRKSMTPALRAVLAGRDTLTREEDL